MDLYRGLSGFLTQFQLLVALATKMSPRPLGRKIVMKTRGVGTGTERYAIAP